MNWWKELKGKVRLKEPLCKHTTFKIGGACAYFIEPKDAADLKLLLNLLKRYKIPCKVIGSGSNILAGAGFIEGAVIHLNSPYFKKINFRKNCLEAGSGCILSRLISAAVNKGFSGCEFMEGIPGTVGGALVMNAGRASEKESFGDLVETVMVMDYNGNTKVLDKTKLEFSYRSSNLGKYIILGAGIKLIKRAKEETRNKIKQYLDYRRATQDYSGPSAGCVFKNPPGSSAGRLIDLCGLKGKSIGKARISENHANFIINMGGAEAGDVLKLIAFVKRKVKNKFNITLEPEIKIWK